MLRTHTCSRAHRDTSRPAPCPPPFAQLLTSGVRHVFWLCYCHVWLAARHGQGQQRRWATTAPDPVTYYLLPGPLGSFLRWGSTTFRNVLQSSTVLRRARTAWPQPQVSWPVTSICRPMPCLQSIVSIPSGIKVIRTTSDLFGFDDYCLSETESCWEFK